MSEILITQYMGKNVIFFGGVKMAFWNFKFLTLKCNNFGKVIFRFLVVFDDVVLDRNIRDPPLTYIKTLNLLTLSSVKRKAPLNIMII